MRRDADGILRQAKFSEAPAMPSARGSHAGARLDGGVIVVASGSAWSEDRTVKSWLSDTLLFADGQWTSGPALPRPAVESAFASDGKSLFIIGGLTAADAPSAEVMELSLGEHRQLRISPLPAFPARHVGGAAAVLDGRLFVAGGYADGKLTDALWMLDLNNRAAGWTKRAPIPAEARAYAALVAAAEDQLYLLGGMTTEGGADGAMRVFKDVFRYDPEADAWQRLGELPAAGYCWAAEPIDDSKRKLLVAGRADGAIHDDVWIVDLSDLSARGVGSTVITTTCAPLVRVNDNTFWLIGGEPDANKTRTARITQILLP
jgi:N-acetylneuraminic acid mutarotase